MGGCIDVTIVMVVNGITSAVRFGTGLGLCGKKGRLRGKGKGGRVGCVGG